MPWEQVEKKFKTKVPARAKKIRRKLNVPSDRFRIHEDGQYVWAGENGDQLFCGELLWLKKLLNDPVRLTDHAFQFWDFGHLSAQSPSP